MQGGRKEPRDAKRRLQGEKGVVSFNTGEENGDRERCFCKRTVAHSPESLWPALDRRFSDVIPSSLSRFAFHSR